MLSVLMTAYNREQFIAEAIESVLESSFTNFELIIVDDCSTDNTVSIAQRYQSTDNRIQIFLNEKNIGDYPNRNKAASYAKGKYLKYVDSDDLVTKDGLEKMVNAMEQFPEAAFGISQFIVDKAIVYPQLIVQQEAYKQHYNGLELFSYGPVGAIIKRDLFNTVHGFNDERYVSDTELWLKLSAQYPVVKLVPGLVIWRQHALQEYKYGNDSFSYLGLTYPMDMKYLSRPQCPLNKAAIKKIKYRLQWKHARDIISLAFKKKKPLLAYTFFIKSGLSVTQLLNGLKSYKSVKNSIDIIDR